MMALTVECRMNGGLWSYTPKNPLFSGYFFFSSNLNLELERGGKKSTNCWVLSFLCSKKTFLNVSDVIHILRPEILLYGKLSNIYVDGLGSLPFFSSYVNTGPALSVITRFRNVVHCVD